MIVGIVGVPPWDKMQSYLDQGAQIFDLDEPLPEFPVRDIFLPNAYCSILKRVVSNIFSLRDSGRLDLVLASVGALLVALGMVAILVHGGGLPMNAYPPPRLVRRGVYAVLRHPIYAAALYVGIGLAFIHANWYALLVALILPLFLTGWVRLVEEKELLERFPDYSDYRKHVPAFWARPRDLVKFFRFLLLDRGG